jgi:signal transduction histidine kinase
VNLREIVADALSERQAEIAAKRLEVEDHLRDVVISGSTTLLRRMVENVIDNAVRHNRRDGWMRVELDDAGEHARLTVQSSGTPLDASQVRGLAQPFRRLAVERTGSENGVGLGLSIVAAIAAAHAGTLQLAARPEGGLRVVIELPHSAETSQTGSGT